MTIKTDRLSESIRIISSEEVQVFMREYDHDFGIVTVFDVTVSSDKSYADVMVHGQGDDKELTACLAPIAGLIHTRISRELGLRRTPRIRFRVAKNIDKKGDVLSLIQELDKQYGLSQ